jgi:hypothetical protein
MSKIGPIACPPRSRFDGAMPRDPFVREKFTRAHGRPQARCGRLSALPQGPLSAEVESWRLQQSQNIEFTMKRLREPIEGAE